MIAYYDSDTQRITIVPRIPTNAVEKTAFAELCLLMETGNITEVALDYINTQNSKMAKAINQEIKSNLELAENLTKTSNAVVSVWETFPQPKGSSNDRY